MPEPVRVARVIDRLVIGGPTKNAVWLSSGLDPQQFETVLITGSAASGESDWTEFARQHGVEPVLIPQMSRELSVRDAAVVVKLIREFLRFRPDIVHTHKSKAGATGRVAAEVYRWLTPSALWLRPRRVRVLHTYHGHVFHGYYGRMKTRLIVAIERGLARWCTDHIIVLCEQQRNEICGEFGVGRPEQFRIVPLGLELPARWRAGTPDRLRSEFGIGNDEVVVGAIGRLCEVKNFDLLLRAFAAARVRLAKKGFTPHLVMIGDGHLRGKLQQLASELGVADTVVFTGYREDAMALYPELDLVALSSLNEGTPLTLIEGMSCGCPALSTEVGGVAALMGERRGALDGLTVCEHGIMVPPRDEASYAAALEFLLSNARLRRQMGTAARGFVQNNFSKERLISDTAALYRQLTPRALASPAPVPMTAD